MVNLEDAIVARLESHGETFEILIDPDVAKEVRDGKEVELLDRMVIDEVFKDARKGTRPADEKIQEVFGTDDIVEIARRIILKGEVQLTIEQRREIMEGKRRRVIGEIAKNAINPQTNSPHPPTRIELALDEAKFHVDPFKPLDQQVKRAMDLLRPMMPIKFARNRIAVRMKGEDYGRCYDDLRALGEVVQDEWQEDGSWIGVVEIPAGVKDELFSRIKSKTKGEAEMRPL